MMTYFFSQILLYTDPSGKGGGFSSLLFLFMIIAVFYFFMIRPQMKKSKDLKKYREALKKGDKVVTIGGIHGKIADIKDTTVILEVEDQNRLKIEKSAIAMDGQGGQIERK